jgi:hypothetical protein
LPIESHELYQNALSIVNNIKEKGKATNKDKEDAAKLYKGIISDAEIEAKDKIKLALMLPYESAMNIFCGYYQSMEDVKKKLIVDSIISAEEFNSTKSETGLERAIGFWCDTVKQVKLDDFTTILLKHIISKSKVKKSHEYKERVVNAFNKFFFEGGLEFLTNMDSMEERLDREDILDFVRIMIKAIDKQNESQKKLILACWIDKTIKVVKNDSNISSTVEEWIKRTDSDQTITTIVQTPSKENSTSNDQKTIPTDKEIIKRPSEKKLESRITELEKEIMILNTKINNYEHKEKFWLEQEKEFQAKLENVREYINAQSTVVENKNKFIENLENKNKELDRVLVEYQGLQDKNETNNLEGYKNEISRALRNDYKDFIKNGDIQSHNELGEMYYYQLEKIFKTIQRLGIKFEIK